jgi:chemotaxis protein MotB
MKEKPSEWIVIADLMSGVVAVVMLMFVVSMVQKQVAEKRHQAEMMQGAESQRRQVAAVLEEMQAVFAREGVANYIAIDAAAGKVTLQERAFRSGSACVEPEAKRAFAQVQDTIKAYLRNFQAGQIYVEGHTDSQPVKGRVTDDNTFCAVYDDNFTLSASRAREARKLLVPPNDTEMARRIVVAGYGDSHPLEGQDPSNARNRRVELRFTSDTDHLGAVLGQPTTGLK